MLTGCLFSQNIDRWENSSVSAEGRPSKTCRAACYRSTRSVCIILHVWNVNDTCRLCHGESAHKWMKWDREAWIYLLALELVEFRGDTPHVVFLWLVVLGERMPVCVFTHLGFTFYSLTCIVPRTSFVPPVTGSALFACLPGCASPSPLRANALFTPLLVSDCELN